MPRFRARVAASLLALATCALAPAAGAVGTRTFDLDTLDELSGGDLKAVAVGSDGVVRAGFVLGNVPVGDATTVHSALALADGSGVLVGTGPGGKVFELAGDKATLFADTKQMAVTALAQDAHGNVYAATVGDNHVYRLTRGKAEVFATLPDVSHVLALAVGRAGTTLFAAAGPDGRVFRINAAGQAEVFFKSSEPDLVSLAVAPNGDVLAGSSGKALLYRITAAGHATVMYDFPGDEVQGIAARPDGTIFAIANEFGDPPDVPHHSASATRSPASPTSTTPRTKPGKGSLWRFDPQGRPERMMHHDEFHYTALALDDAGQPYVGTGAEGRVYTVDDAHTITLVADTDERQIAALSLHGLPKNAARPGVGAFLVSSDGAVFHRILGKGGADAVWTSKVFDAGLRAHFGVLSWRSTGPLEISTRTGNTSDPDTTWSAWSTPMVGASGRVTSPAARFFQVRARWSRAPNAELSEVRVPFVTDNLRAVVTEVSAEPKSGTPSDKEGLQESGGALPKHDSVLKVTWKVDNPDSDQLRYRLYYRLETERAWRAMLRTDEIVTKTTYDWDTATLPEGKYRVRVEASDEMANPPSDVQRHALDSRTVLVDNTPPVFAQLALAGRRLTARVVDGVGPVARLEVSIDGQDEWRPVVPVDGVFDSATESFAADVSAIVPTGSHIVAVRAFDAAGNAVIKNLEAR